MLWFWFWLFPPAEDGTEICGVADCEVCTPDENGW